MLYKNKLFLKEFMEPRSKSRAAVAVGLSGTAAALGAYAIHKINKKNKEQEQLLRQQLEDKFNKYSKFKTYNQCKQFKTQEEIDECRRSVGTKYAVRYQYEKRDPNEYYA